jgi:dihydroorotase
MFNGYPVIDMHTHVIREDWSNDIFFHTSLAKKSGIDWVVFMANSTPPLDSLRKIEYLLPLLKERAVCKTAFVSAITKGLDGKELVDVEAIRPYVVGFSDDGKYLEDLGLLQNILEMNVLVLAHCSPPYEDGIENPDLETKFIERYLPVLERTNGRLHIQHISKKESVELIRDAKMRGLQLTCETCPHYFTFSGNDLDAKVNPPLATVEDITAIREGLSDGTIDVIASDYAPKPRKTGIAGFRSFIPLVSGLLLQRVLTEEQLKEKIYLNPKKIIEKGGMQIDLGWEKIPLTMKR